MNAACYWITGLSGSGKTTQSKKLTKYLLDNNKPVILLDGDILRIIMDSKAYNYHDRLKLGYQYSKLCNTIVSQNINVVIAVIGLFHELHLWNRENIKSYIEIFLDTPIEELRKRDPKKLYKKASDKKIQNLVGVDIEPEFPNSPDIHIKWKKGMDENKTFDELMLQLNR